MEYSDQRPYIVHEAGELSKSLPSTSGTVATSASEKVMLYSLPPSIAQFSLLASGSDSYGKIRPPGVSAAQGKAKKVRISISNTECITGTYYSPSTLRVKDLQSGKFKECN